MGLLGRMGVGGKRVDTATTIVPTRNVRNGLWAVGHYCIIFFIYIFLYINCVYAN